MSSLFSDPTEFPWAMPFTGGQGFCADGPYVNPALLWAPTGDSILEAPVLGKQAWTSVHRSDEVPSPSHFYNPRAKVEMEAFLAKFLACDQLELQPNLSINEARPHGTRGQITFQDAQDCDRGNMNRRARTTCADCNKSFGRPQELSRHRQDVHKKPRHCLFCGVKWTRPSNIKAHLLAKHHEKFTAELLVVIQALRGRTIVDFLDGYTEGPGVAVEHTQGVL